jgi:hypothetical protein
MIKETLKNIVNDLFESSKNYKPLNYLPYPLNEKEQKKGAGAGKQIKLFFKSVAEMEQLNEQWIFKMTYTKAVLREKITFFWHNHFATSMQIAYLMQVQNNTLRANALGSFKTMLHAVSKDPAMIIYLNNQQNVKDHPNENFAREVMELFTLGEGNYTEKDIKEAARAFTGWTTNKMGDFERDARIVRERKLQEQQEKQIKATEDLREKCIISVNTTMIGALNELEETMGALWGHGKHVNELNIEQKRNRDLWNQARQAILDRGNEAAEKASYHINRFTINYKTTDKKYNYNFKLNNNSGQ